MSNYIIKKYITHPHQIDITYRNTFSDDDINKIGETLEDKLDKITGSGRIINNENLIVHVRKQEKFVNFPISFSRTFV